jgi:two-component system, OmpR family, response regulator
VARDSARPPFGGLTALVVDDDETLVELVAERLRGCGLSVETAVRGDDALARLRALKPDVCVLDLILPVIDGWRLLEIAHSEQMTTPIIVISGHAGRAAGDRSRALGAAAHLVKPISLEALARRAVRLARRRRQDEIDAHCRQLIVGELLIDPVLNDVRVAGEPLGLTNFEFEIVYVLALNFGRVVSRAELITAVWPDEPPRRPAVDLVARIRRKLSAAGIDPNYVRGHRGRGYELRVP